MKAILYVVGSIADRRVLSLWLAFLPAEVLPAVLLTDVPVPPNAVIEIISVDVVHNGHTLSMATFEAPQSTESTLAFYQQSWPDPETGNMPGMILSRTPDWILISHLEGGYNTVVQLSTEQTHKSTGFVSIMPVESPQLAVTRESTHELQLLSETDAHDGISSSRLSVYSSNSAVSALTGRLLHQREGAHWRLTSRQAYGTSQVILMSRPGKELELVVSQSDTGGSIVVANEIDFDD